MAQCPTPPDSPQGSETHDVDTKDATFLENPAELIQSLDALLERYLDLIDRHQKLHAELAKQLSAGFLSLAQANYSCSPGRRYGADYYDERMSATRKMLIEPRSFEDLISNPASGSTKDIYFNESVHNFAIVRTTDNEQRSGQKKTERGRQDKDTFQENRARLDDERGSSSDGRKVVQCESPPADRHRPSKSGGLDTTKKKPLSLDPITWYGILVPPALRSAQQDFTGAVESQVPALASVMNEMRAVENEINRLRHELGEG